MKIRFQNPPINELVIATYFSPIIFDLHNEHIGLFWSKIRDKFPDVSQQPTTGGLNAYGAIKNEISPMPRYWFIGSDGARILQVQKNAFVLNWHRNDALCPNFHEHLKPTFDKYYTAFSDFVVNETETDKLSIDLCELTYINMIPKCEYWSGPDDTSKVLPSFSIPNPSVETDLSASFHCTYVYPLASDLQLRVTISIAAQPDLPEDQVLIIKIEASGRLGEVSKSDTDSWFDRAHDAVVSCFADITDKEIQNKFWIPMEEGS